MFVNFGIVNLNQIQSRECLNQKPKSNLVIVLECFEGSSCNVIHALNVADLLGQLIANQVEHLLETSQMRAKLCVSWKSASNIIRNVVVPFKFELLKEMLLVDAPDFVDFRFECPEVSSVFRQ